jgi:hypothetical protein
LCLWAVVAAQVEPRTVDEIGVVGVKGLDEYALQGAIQRPQRGLLRLVLGDAAALVESASSGASTFLSGDTMAFT